MEIKVIGDSHSKFFNTNRSLLRVHPHITGHNISVESIKGATISGFGNRNATLNVKEQILENHINKNVDFYVFNFGQVDLELGYFYKYYIKNERFDFTTYIEEQAKVFLDWITSNMECKKCIIKGVNIPALCFDQNKAINYTKRIITENLTNSVSIANALDEMKKTFPNDLQRTSMAIRYNESLRKECRTRGVMYFDINEFLLNPDNKIIKTEFVPSTLDHHLVDSIHTRSIHINALLNRIYNNYPI